MNRYDFIAWLECNNLHVEKNEHACNYVTAKTWIEEYSPEDFAETPADLVQEMKDKNTIWRLQIYPNTPIGFSFWFGPTLDSVIDQARDVYKSSEQRS